MQILLNILSITVIAIVCVILASIISDSLTTIVRKKTGKSSYIQQSMIVQKNPKLKNITRIVLFAEFVILAIINTMISSILISIIIGILITLIINILYDLWLTNEIKKINN